MVGGIFFWKEGFFSQAGFFFLVGGVFFGRRDFFQRRRDGVFFVGGVRLDFYFKYFPIF